MVFHSYVIVYQRVTYVVSPLNICVYIYIYNQYNIYIHIYIHIYVYICIYIYIYTYMYKPMAWTLIWSTLSSFDGCHSGTSHIVCTKTRPGVALFYLHWHAQILGVMIDISIVNAIIQQLIIGGHHLASFSHQQHIKTILGCERSGWKNHLVYEAVGYNGNIMK